MLETNFFTDDSCEVAKSLLGKVIRRQYKNTWLSARIIETEAYYLSDKASHASLGFSEERKAIFMPPGTIYMYYARGHDSFNISCGNEGDAVLIKSAFPVIDKCSPTQTIAMMQKLNPAKNGSLRPPEKLCGGQTLLCKSLNLKVKDWDQQQFNQNIFYIEDVEQKPEKIIQTYRLGIHQDRDAHLLYRFIDFEFVKYCSGNPLNKKAYHEGEDYFLL